MLAPTDSQSLFGIFLRGYAGKTAGEMIRTQKRYVKQRILRVSETNGYLLKDVQNKAKGDAVSYGL